jgi:hypothetical protein
MNTALNLLALLVFIALTLLAVRAGAEWVTRLLWKSCRRSVTLSADRIASALGLAAIPSPDLRMGLWHGHIPGAELWLATGAYHLGPRRLMLEPTGPSFSDGAPVLVFGHFCNLLLVVRYSHPLPVQFSLSSMYGVKAGIVTGDALFDQRCRLNGVDSSAIKLLFGELALRDSLLHLFGEDCRDTRLIAPLRRNPRLDGTGVMVAANEQGMVVYWSSPCEEHAADFATALVRAGSTLAAANKRG